MNDQDEQQPLHYPLEQLERRLIGAYVADAGYSVSELLARTDAEARRVLAEASQYASEKLSEIEARSNYVRHLHGRE